MVKVLFVCTGNICRSPTAEGVFRALVAEAGLNGEIEIDSAGTGSWHVGDPPDPRTCAAAARRGIDLGRQRARQVMAQDFDGFDYIIAMDSANLSWLRRLCPPVAGNRLHLFMGFTNETRSVDVPDPYYGGEDGFEQVLDMVERGGAALLDHIRRTHL